MKKKLKRILEGWGNVLRDSLHLLPEEVKTLSETRLLICDGCPVRDGSVCSTNKSDIHKKTGETQVGCGCPLIAKTMVPDEECPLGHW
jgi:hypothetical protein